MAALPDRSQGLAGGMISAMRTVGIVSAAMVAPGFFAARQASHAATGGAPTRVFAVAFSDTFLACAIIAAAGAALCAPARLFCARSKTREISVVTP